MPRRLGPWTLEKQLGEGGFGEVWLGARPDGSRAAIKLFRAELSERIRRAPISAIAAVRHPNVHRLIELGESEEGKLYLASEYIEGESLRARLERGALPASEVRTLGRAMAGALAALHARQLVHRDVKPDNILIPHSGTPADAQLTDLSLVGELEGDAHTTQAGVLIGTPVYMAPEQIAGAGLGPAADIWALGVVLFEAATGRLPFEKTSMVEVMLAIRTAELPLEIVPAELRGVLAQMLQRDPERRPAAADVERLLAAESPIEPPLADPVRPAPGPPEIPARPVARRAYPVVALAAAAVVLGGLLWLLASALGWTAALAVAGGAIAGALVIVLARRARVRGGASHAGKAEQIAALASSRSAVTRSIAIALDQLIASSKTGPRAGLLTASMALVIDGYEAALQGDPDKRLDATLKVVEVMLQLEQRVQALQAPWYVRYEKPVALVSALGSAAAIWLGLSKQMLGTDSSEARLIRGCPSSPVARESRVLLEAVDGAHALVWSVNGRDVLVGASFRWPADVGVDPGPGNYVVRATLDDGSAASERCLIEVAELR